jgi:hypothetical protein
LQLGRVRADRADAADPAGPGDHRRLDQIGAPAVQHLLHVGQHARRLHIDDRLARAEHGIGDLFDDERRADRFEHGGFHARLPR